MPDGVKPGRIPCCVPFCRRTADAAKFKGCTEIICGKHWRTAPRTWRRRYSRLYRRHRQLCGRGQFWDLEPGTPARKEAVRLCQLLGTLWEWCKRAAIERAAGL
jgi:hypothetical protein